MAKVMLLISNPLLSTYIKCFADKSFHCVIIRELVKECLVANLGQKQPAQNILHQQ